MSFFSDLFRGNFGNLGNDITHAPSSLISHPDELAETIGAGALIAAPFVFPEIGGALGIGAAADAGGALAADAATAGGAFAADAGGALAADAAGGAAALGTDALAFAPEAADALSIGPAIGGVGDSILPDTATLATGPIDFGGDAAASATPAGFAPTDAELSGATTGTATAPSTAAGGASSSSGGFTSMLSDTLKSPWTRLGLAAAPLALTLARGESSLPPQTDAAVSNATALANQGANLNSAQQATIAQMRQDLINQYRQVLFNQGVQNPEKDTRWPQMLAQIDSQVTAATQQMIQQNIQNSLAGDQQLIQIAGLQMQADQNFSNALLNATKALGTAAGLGGGVQLKLA